MDGVINMEQETYEQDLTGISLFYAKNGEVSSFRITTKAKTPAETIKRYEELRDYCLKEQEIRKFIPK